MAKTNSRAVLKLEGIHKSFKVGDQDLEIIKGAGFDVNQGDFLILFGPSGCGKSTLLNILLGLEPPTEGEVIFLGDSIYKYDDDKRGEIRKKNVGMVYQQSNWVKALNVIENVYFPLTLMGMLPEEREKKAWEVLKLVGMESGAYQNPAELSSGQQQRISLARALISEPALIVADEPTGNLDSKASKDIMELFKKFNEEDKTVIMVTHDLEYLSYATRAVNVSDGVIVAEYKASDKKLKDLSVSKRGNLDKYMKVHEKDKVAVKKENIEAQKKVKEEKKVEKSEVKEVVEEKEDAKA
jgi:putative ABC transport system ATP-binding protein